MMGVLLGLQVLVGVHQEGRKGEGSGGEGKVAGVVVLTLTVM